jgi:hypothetical protein
MAGVSGRGGRKRPECSRHTFLTLPSHFAHRHGLPRESHENSGGRSASCRPTLPQIPTTACLPRNAIKGPSWDRCAPPLVFLNSDPSMRVCLESPERPGPQTVGPQRAGPHSTPAAQNLPPGCTEPCPSPTPCQADKINLYSTGQGTAVTLLPGAGLFPRLEASSPKWLKSFLCKPVPSIYADVSSSDAHLGLCDRGIFLLTLLLGWHSSLESNCLCPLG